MPPLAPRVYVGQTRSRYLLRALSCRAPRRPTPGWPPQSTLVEEIATGATDTALEGSNGPVDAAGDNAGPVTRGRER